MNIRYHHTRLAGNYVATCDDCGHTWGYWECASELSHDCTPEIGYVEVECDRDEGADL